MVYPNPANGLLFVDAKTEEALDAEILDLTGRVAGRFQSTDFQGRLKIATHNLAAGTYIVRIKSAAHTTQQRVMIIH